MLRTIKTLQNYQTITTDDEIGTVNNFYFDDQEWVIRYLVVDIGTWFSSQKVLISPQKLGQPDWEAQQFPIKLTQAEVEDSPDIHTIQPVSQQQELETVNKPTYNWPPISRLGGGILMPNAIGMHPQAIVETVKSQQKAKEVANSQPEMPQTTEKFPHLRSTDHVIGYYIVARDGNMGHVEDFLIEDETWAIHYMIVDTRNWLPGKKVIVSPTWIKTINWDDSTVQIDLSQKMIEHSPEFDPSMPVDRAYEEKLFEHYDRPKYWG